MPNSIEHLTRAQEFLSGRHWHPEALTMLLPIILYEQDARLAHRLIGETVQVPDITQWLPEALTLFNVKKLTELQTYQMNRRIFGLLSSAKVHGINHLVAQCNAKLGRIGFSFPIWRYVTKQFDSMSLFEHFGFIRLTRDSDRYRFGPGFVWQRKQLYIEYRQAYILCSNQYCTLLIRNSSFFFGRDKLHSPIYVSPKPLTAYELCNITEIVLENEFIKWQNLFDTPQPALLIRQVLELLNAFDRLDNSFFRWLVNSGRSHLIYFLKSHHEQSPVVVSIRRDAPPWVPKQTFANAVNWELELDEFIKQNSTSDNKIVLLSGLTGDFPYSIKS